jgi:hypothetical protein
MAMYIGKIVNSGSHVDYTCQVYNPGEVEHLPQPEDYGFGAWVGVEGGQGGCLVGAIYNTILLNPEFGSLGPRLSPREELSVFSPDYLAEKATLVAVVILGALRVEKQALVPHQGVPSVAASIDDRVRGLRREEIVAFHTSDRGLRLGYLPTLTAMNNPLAAQLVLRIIAMLCELFPADAQRLAILRNNLAWRVCVDPVG